MPFRTPMARSVYSACTEELRIDKAPVTTTTALDPWQGNEQHSCKQARAVTSTPLVRTKQAGSSQVGTGSGCGGHCGLDIKGDPKFSWLWKVIRSWDSYGCLAVRKCVTAGGGSWDRGLTWKGVFSSLVPSFTLCYPAATKWALCPLPWPSASRFCLRASQPQTGTVSQNSSLLLQAVGVAYFGPALGNWLR